MGSRRTTRCCSALTLTLAWSLAWDAGAGVAQQSPPPAQPRSSKPGGHRATSKLSPPAFFPAAPLWTLPLNTGLTAPPAFEGRHGFFPIEDNRLVAYDLARGSQMWIAPVATGVAPAASPDLLFVVEAEALVALQVKDGSPQWRLPFTEPLAVPLVWDNGWLVAATVDGTVIAFRGSDGSIIWRRSVGSAAHAPPSLAADRVYIPTEDGRVVALRVETGALIWEHRLGGAASDILALDERLYVGSKDNVFYCLKTEDGEVAWHWTTGGDVIGLPVADQRTIYFVSLDNVLRALNRHSGNQRWKRPLLLRPTSGPVEAAGTLLVRGASDKLPGYKEEDGTAAGDAATGGDIVAPPYVVKLPATFGAVLIVVTRDIVKGVTVTALATSSEPSLIPSVGVLANPVTFSKAAPPKQ